MLHPTHKTTNASCALSVTILETAPNTDTTEPQFKISSHFRFIFVVPAKTQYKYMYIFCLNVRVFPNLTGEYLAPTLHWSLNLGFVCTL